jgi:hypothetical protein
MTRTIALLANSCALVAMVVSPSLATDWGQTLAPGGRSGSCFGLAADEAGVIVAGQLAETHENAGQMLDPLGEADEYLARFDASGRGVASAR